MIRSAQKRFIRKKQPGSKAQTLFIECILAIDKALYSLIIFKGKSVQQQWFSFQLQSYKGWKFDATENGWTSDATALEWLKTVFIPQSAPREATVQLIDPLNRKTTKILYSRSSKVQNILSFSRSKLDFATRCLCDQFFSAALD